MSSRRKPSNTCVCHVATQDSEEKETVLGQCFSVAPVTGQSRTPQNNEEEQLSKGGLRKEQGFFFTLSYRDQENFPQSDSFNTRHIKSLSCHGTVQKPVESCSEFRPSVLDHSTEDEVDAPSQESVGTIYDFQYSAGHSGSSAGENTAKTSMEDRTILDKALEVEEQHSPVQKEEMRAVSVNGTIILPEPTCHVMPLLQRPPNLSTSPTVAVPLHTSEYNPLLDNNPTLITSFNRFPYPTHAELSWLTATSRHPEEQIKVWFTTQRLKQGITWSPEEVEEARKKMFNGCSMVPPTPQIVYPVDETLNPGQVQSAALQAPGQTSNTADVPSVTGIPEKVRQGLKRRVGTPHLALEVKRPANRDPREVLCMPPPPLAAVSELSESSSPVSLVASDMERPFAPLKGKLCLVELKEKIPKALLSEAPKERLPLSPIVSTNLKRSSVCQQMNINTSASSDTPKNKFSCFADNLTLFSAPAVNRSTVVQSLPSPALFLQSTEPSVLPRYATQKSRDCGDEKHWSFEQAQYDSENSCVEFSRREHSIPTLPLLDRVEDKTPRQIKLLEESFTRSSFPSYNEVDHLMITTRLCREDIESWFLERRALRDNLEEALLYSMGSTWEQTVLSSAPRRSGPIPQDKSFLKNVQSHWHPPVELRNLEVQRCLARTELVRWFRDKHPSQQRCVLDWRETIGQHNGCQPADTTTRQNANECPLTEEKIKPSSCEIGNRFEEPWSCGR